MDNVDTGYTGHKTQNEVNQNENPTGKTKKMSNMDPTKKTQS